MRNQRYGCGVRVRRVWHGYGALLPLHARFSLEQCCMCRWQSLQQQQEQDQLQLPLRGCHEWIIEWFWKGSRKLFLLNHMFRFLYHVYHFISNTHIWFFELRCVDTNVRYKMIHMMEKKQPRAVREPNFELGGMGWLSRMSSIPKLKLCS